MLDLDTFTRQVNLVVLLRLRSSHHHLDPFGSLGLEVTNRWVEPKVIFVACTPAELDVFVTVVHNLEGGGLGSANDAVTDD